jgi:hypothetical protein
MNGSTRADKDTSRSFSNARTGVMIVLWVCWMAIMLGAARVATDRDRTPHERYPDLIVDTNI